MPASQRQRDEKEQTNRLHNMLVHEVSIVDRPANQRRFLVVKGENEMGHAAHELVDDGRGGLVTADKAGDDKGGDDDKSETKDKADDKPVDKGKGDDKKLLHPDDKDKKPKGKQEDEDEEDEKKPPFGGDRAPPFGGKSDDAKKAISEAAAHVNSLVESCKAAGVELDDETKEKLETAKKALDALSGSFAPTDKSNDDDSTPAPPGSNDAIDALKAAGADDDTIAALNKLLGRKGASIEKAGARMAKERLERFRKAMELLQTLLKEFLPELQAQAKVEKSASTNPLALLSLFRSPGDAAFVADFAKRAKADPDLVDKINGLTELVKKQSARVEQISKASSGSNVIPIERQTETKSDDEHAWPIDMNRPITRETVDKSVSFFDVE